MNPQMMAMLQDPRMGPFLMSMFMGGGQNQQSQGPQRVPGNSFGQAMNPQLLWMLMMLKNQQQARQATAAYNSQQPTYFDPTQTPGYTPSPTPIPSYPSNSGPFVPVPAPPTPGQGPTAPPQTSVPNQGPAAFVSGPQSPPTMPDPSVYAMFSPNFLQALKMIGMDQMTMPGYVPPGPMFMGA